MSEAEIITLEDINQGFETRELSDGEKVKLHDDLLRTKIKSAINGELFWYEVSYVNPYSNERGISWFFIDVNQPIEESQSDIESILKNIPGGSVVDIKKYFGVSAQIKSEEIDEVSTSPDAGLGSLALNFTFETIPDMQAQYFERECTVLSLVKGGLDE